MSSTVKITGAGEFRSCGSDLLLPAAAKVSKSAGRRGGNSNAPSPAPLPSDQRGPFGAPLDSPKSVCSSVRTSRKELAHPFGHRNRRAFAQSANSDCDVRRDEPLPNGGSNGGPVGPPWSFRKRGESRGEKNPLERVFLPSGVLLPSFPTREKKVAPAGAKLLLSSLPQERNPCLTNLLNHV